MSFVLIAWIISATTGEPSGFERIQSYPEAQQCVDAMNEGLIAHVVDGKIKSYQCVRSDQLGEADT